jgi:hypothetical protein
MLVITGLIAMGAVLLVSPNEISALLALPHRLEAIRSHPSDPYYREPYPIVAFYHRLDEKIAPDARIFFSGMIGPDKRPRLYCYFFARTYLFPRQVDVSLDGKPVFHDDAFDGVDCTSPDELRAHGFDVQLKLEKNGDVTVVPLTKKGSLKQ